LIATEDTLFKVYEALLRAGLSGDQAQSAIMDMQNVGLYFRELES
jgi:hypothetical protein